MKKKIKEIKPNKQVINIKPDDAEVHYNQGTTYNKLGRHTEAVEAFKRAIRINPDLPEAHYGMGVTYYLLGHYTEAVEAFKHAIRIKPDHAVTHYNIGVTYNKLMHYTEAVEAFKHAIRIDPDYYEAHCNLGVAYGNLGNHSEAGEAFKQAIRINPDLPEAHFYLGLAYDKLGHYTQAIEAYKQAIRIKPDNAEVLYNLGVNYGRLRRNQEAMEAFKQTINIKPNYAKAHFGLGTAYLFLGDRNSALNEYKIFETLNDDLANKVSGGSIKTYSFSLCSDCLEKYKALCFDPSCSYVLNTLPLTSLQWEDEHPKKWTSECCKECKTSICNLVQARDQLWRECKITDQYQNVWTQSQRMIPNWPGFNRLTLNDEQIEELDECLEGLTELIEATVKKYPNIEIIDEGRGLSELRASREDDKQPKKRWWQFRPVKKGTEK